MQHYRLKLLWTLPIHCTYHGHNSRNKVHNASSILITVYHSNNQLSRTLNVIIGNSFEPIPLECHNTVVLIYREKVSRPGPVLCICGLVKQPNMYSMQFSSSGTWSKLLKLTFPTILHQL